MHACMRTVESMFQPPACSMAVRRHTPAVPLKPKKVCKKDRARCSTAKWKLRHTCCTLQGTTVAESTWRLVKEGEGPHRPYTACEMKASQASWNLLVLLARMHETLRDVSSHCKSCRAQPGLCTRGFVLQTAAYSPARQPYCHHMPCSASRCFTQPSKSPLPR
jgi:hypothetical protein